MRLGCSLVVADSLPDGGTIPTEPPDLTVTLWGRSGAEQEKLGGLANTRWTFRAQIPSTHNITGGKEETNRLGSSRERVSQKPRGFESCPLRQNSTLNSSSSTSSYHPADLSLGPNLGPGDQYGSPSDRITHFLVQLMASWLARGATSRTLLIDPFHPHEYRIEDNQLWHEIGVEWIDTQGHVRTGVLVRVDGVSEPFQVPQFEPFNPGSHLVPFIDVPALFNEGVSIDTGDIFTVTNGIVPGLSSITFREFANYPPDDFVKLLDPNFANSVPLYTGKVGVDGFTTFSQVPEPSSVALCGASMLVLFGMTKGRRKILKP